MPRIETERDYWRAHRTAQLLLAEARTSPKAWARAWSHRKGLACALTAWDIQMEYVRRREAYARKTA